MKALFCSPFHWARYSICRAVYLGSPSLAAYGATPRDILMTSNAADAVVWASGADLGLQVGDVIDAICVDDDNDSLGVNATQPGGACASGVAVPRFRDCIELFVGTDPLDPCANTAIAGDEATDKMPADLNDDKVVNVTDRTLTALAIKAYAGGAGVYNARYDLNASGTLNITDRTIVVLYIKLTGSIACTP